MILWLETLGVIGLVAASGWAGQRLGRHDRWWKAGYAGALVIVLALAAARRFHQLAGVPPVTWLLVGRLEFVLMAAAIPILVLCLRQRVKQRRLRFALLVLMVIGVAGYVLPAFAGPALLQGHYQRMENQYVNGICQQSTAYTCGPAAAVILLEHVGQAASEGELAVAMRTGPLTGTDEGLLGKVLEDRYGLEVELQTAATVREIPSVAIAVMRYSLWVDHYVAVLEVTADEVVVGDPAAGLRRLSHHAFRRECRGRLLVAKGVP